MQLLVGSTALLGKIGRYAERFGILELRADPARLPNAKALRKLRSSAPRKLVFSLLVPPNLSSGLLQASSSIDFVRGSADALDARWVVVQTGPDIGSSARARARLQALAAQLKTDTRRVAWEPRGPWEAEAAREAADALGITLVEDLSMVKSPPSAIVYTRLRAVGPGASLRASAMERLAEQIAAGEEVYVVIEGAASPKARQRILQAIAAVGETQTGLGSNGLAALSNDDDDDEDDDGDEDEDEDDGDGGATEGEEAFVFADAGSDAQKADDEDDEEDDDEDDDEDDEEDDGVQDDQGDDEDDEDDEDDDDDDDDDEDDEEDDDKKEKEKPKGRA